MMMSNQLISWRFFIYIGISCKYLSHIDTSWKFLVFSKRSLKIVFSWEIAMSWIRRIDWLLGYEFLCAFRTRAWAKMRTGWQSALFIASVFGGGQMETKVSVISKHRGQRIAPDCPMWKVQRVYKRAVFDGDKLTNSDISLIRVQTSLKSPSD